jgi:hypothetical protein
MTDDELKIWKEMFDNIPPENVIHLSRKDTIAFLRAIGHDSHGLQLMEFGEAVAVFKAELWKSVERVCNPILTFIKRLLNYH